MKKLLTSCLLYASVLAASSLSASHAITLSQSPLFLGTSADPNIMFTLDDSGSMRFEIMPEDIITSDARFIYPRQSGVYGSTSEYTNKVPTFSTTSAVNAYYRSAYNNKLYYNPLITYTPWSKSDGSLFAPANIACALHNPMRTTTITSVATPGVNAYCRNLTISNKETATYLTSFTGATSGTSQTYWPAFYYTYKGSGDLKTLANYIRVDITSGNTYTDRPNRTDCAARPTCTYAEEIQNFANWYTYYRARVLAARSGVGKAFAKQGENIRVGFTTINTSDSTISAVKSFTTENRVTFFNSLYGSVIPAQGTPLRRALDDVGKYYSSTSNSGPWSATPGTSSTISHLTCRQSYNILMTDGYWNGDAATTAGARLNVDNTSGSTITGPNGQSYRYTPAAPFKDSDTDTLADVAMYYWNRDLRTDLANKVTPNPKDPAFWQHMVTFTVGLGVEGTLKQSDYPALLAGTKSWPNQDATEDARRIDDLWHAAVNGHGGFFSASDPNTFADALAATLADIAERTSSASAVATNSSKISTDTQLFQGSFNSADWTGQLKAYPIDSDGVVQSASWYAASLIPVYDTRNILSYKPGTGGITFEWSNLSTSQQALLNLPINSTTSDGKGSLRVAFLRGDQSNELANNGIFRNRNSLLGDIVNSNPAYVGKDDYGYSLSSSSLSSAEKVSYTSFRNGSSYQSREPMIYVGANDGMLHGFRASNGREVFGYVPNAIYGNLSALTSPLYAHKYYVDGSPKVGDAYINGQWKTVLLGSTGAGGKSLFALDITAPSTMTAEKVLWEVDQSTVADLGYTQPQPSFGKANSGHWIAIAGNGYNSSNNRAKLLVFNLATGDVLANIDTGVGSTTDPNGLATPLAIDLNGDRIIDYVYAGDMQGNFWKFDLTSSNPAQWRVALTQSTTPIPLFRACNTYASSGTACSTTANRQAITAKPIAMLHPDGGVMVIFATGSYIATEDLSAATKYDAVYGIRDNSETSTVSINSLIMQSIIFEQAISAENPEFGIRILSNTAVDYSTKKGWYMKLASPNSTGFTGERVVSDLQINNGRLIYTSIIPSADPCEFGGKSWLMEQEPVSGARLSYSVFDVNDDGKIDGNDYITITINGQTVTAPVSGQSFDQLKSKDTIISNPTNPEVELKFSSGSNGEIISVEEQGGGDLLGRQSWRELQ